MNMRGGSVPHLDRIQDSPGILSVPKRSNSSLTYSTLSRVQNVNTSPANSIPVDYPERASELIMTSSHNM